MKEVVNPVSEAPLLGDTAEAMYTPFVLNWTLLRSNWILFQPNWTLLIKPGGIVIKRSAFYIKTSILQIKPETPKNVKLISVLIFVQ